MQCEYAMAAFSTGAKFQICAACNTGDFPAHLLFSCRRKAKKRQDRPIHHHQELFRTDNLVGADALFTNRRICTSAAGQPLSHPALPMCAVCCALHLAMLLVTAMCLHTPTQTAHQSLRHLWQHLIHVVMFVVGLKKPRPAAVACT